MRFLGWFRPNPAKRYNRNHLEVNIGYGVFKSEKEIIKALKKTFPLLTKADINAALSETNVRGGTGNTFTMFYPELKYTKEVEGIKISRVTGNDQKGSEFCTCEGWEGCCRTLSFYSKHVNTYTLKGNHPKHVKGKEGPFPPAYQKGRHINCEHPGLELDEENAEWMEVHYGE